ncbi:MAG: LytTR family DNA-binding domain-containing protein [Saprospiraceae bacterium]
MLKAVIVEDMPQALQVLKADIETYCPDVEVIGTAGSIVQAAKLLQEKQPDILFLDILLGDGTGFDLLEIFPRLNARVIFVTASDEYAVRAFRFAAIDYLLKPVEPDLLMAAVARARQSMDGSNKEKLDLLKETIRQPESLPKRISLNTQERIVIVEIAEIVRCEADSNNTRIILASGEQVYVTRTLKQFDQLFEKHDFLRVHQSHLLNTNYIQEYVKKDGGILVLKNGHQVPVSLRKKAELMDLLEGLK